MNCFVERDPAWAADRVAFVGFDSRAGFGRGIFVLVDVGRRACRGVVRFEIGLMRLGRDYQYVACACVAVGDNRDLFGGRINKN